MHLMYLKAVFSKLLELIFPALSQKSSQVTYVTLVPRGNETLRRTLGERHQRCPALNHKCNQSKLTARRQVRVTSRPGCLKAREVQPAPASRNEAKL